MRRSFSGGVPEVRNTVIGTAESKSAGQLHIQDFFRPLGDEQRESQTRERFTDHTSKLKLMRVRQKRKKTKLAKYDSTYGFHTQNVMGMPKAAASLEAWFSHFRQRQDCGALDVVLIQETHVLGEETTRMQHDYSRSWGFNDATEGRVFSLWSPAPDRRGGVAILLNPYSAIQTLVPFMPQHWTAHWMAVLLDLHGTQVLVINCYAPTDKLVRENVFASMHDLSLSHDGPIFFGGDFNCTLHGTVDRSYGATAGSHDSVGLRSLLTTWKLEDVLADEVTRAEDSSDLMTFRKRHHTYVYTLPGGESASSRLDRWHCTLEHDDWVRNVAQSVPAPYSDHNGVTIRVAPPDRVIQLKKPRRIYPVPTYAAVQAARVEEEFFSNATQHLTELKARHPDEHELARATAAWWDQAKHSLKIGYLNAKKEAKGKITASYRQRIDRLHRKLDQMMAGDAGQRRKRSADEGRDPTESADQTMVEVRREIAACRSRWQLTKRQALFRSHSYHPARTTKALFRRVTTKFMDNTIYDLGGRARHNSSRSRELAGDMCDGWRATMQQHPSDPDLLRTFIDSLTRQGPNLDLGSIAAEITEDEVRYAVKKCQRGKAQGPDEMGNDWYRDHAEALTPLLAELFNLWLRGSALPDSFGEATVHCIKKSRTSATPLDHRPIALLNSDYKIFTRIFAVRIRPVLPKLVNSMQAGFVPGRLISTIIDTLLSAQHRAARNPDLQRAIALLLDFAKAYDSLDRAFLAEALRFLGFPATFVQLVTSLHSNTRCRFQVNGFLSEEIEVSCGIRQGCPLAPLLFILALELLYKRVESDPDLHGVRLTERGDTREVKICGYADDTTIYLQTATDIPRVLAILDEFGAASGLKVNVHKSAVLPLVQGTEIDKEDLCGMTLVEEHGHCRYLGILVGQSSSTEANWTKCTRSLTTSLHLARMKTMSVAQRALIARAVVIPKILYIARHVWPPLRVVEELQQIVKHFVWGVRDGENIRAWLSDAQAELPSKEGGIGIPNVRLELLTMATITVGRWAADGDAFDRTLGDILLSVGQSGGTVTPVYLTPQRTASRVDKCRYRSTLWESGALTLEDAQAILLTETEKAQIRCTAESFFPALHASVWRGASLTFNLESKLDEKLINYLVARRATNGSFCAEWLQHASIDTSGWLIDRNGRPYRLAKTSALVNGCERLGDLVDWVWTSKGVITFRKLTGSTSPPGPIRRAFERLCAALLYNYPELLYRPHREQILRPTTPEIQQHHEWALSSDSTTLVHTDTRSEGTRHLISTMSSCDKAATSDLRRTQVTFQAHPRLSRLVQIWGGEARWRPHRKRYYRYVASKRREIGVANRDRALSAQVKTDSGINRGLSELVWKDIQRIPGLNTYATQTLFRLKANKTPLWNRRDKSTCCPHPQCSRTSRATSQHIFWDCPTARAAWSSFLRRWHKVGISASDDLQEWVFSLEIPDTPRAAWQAIESRLTAQDQEINQCKDELFPVAQLLWRFTAATTIHCIWSARLRRLDGGTQSDLADSAIMGVALHNGMRSLRRLMEDLNEPERYTAYSRVLGAYVDTLLDRELSPLVPCPAESENANEFFLLFFDGGSRGNPGPGGSGAVVVRVQADSHAAEIQWVASMSYGHPSTTNNTAEYWGLVHGLRHAQEARLQPLHVVGDSAIIISQQRTHRPPKKKHLLQLYHKARRIADVIGVKSWTHHYRAFNKMADHAANAAMDSRTSQQAAATHPREIISTVAQFLDNDVLHWLTERPGGIMRLRPHENPEPNQSQQLQHYIESFARTAPSVR